MQIFEWFLPVFLIDSGVLYFGLRILIYKYGMDLVAKSADGLGFLVMGAAAISYLTHVLEKRMKKVTHQFRLNISLGVKINYITF